MIPSEPLDIQRARDIVALIKRWPGRSAWTLGKARHSVEIDGSVVLFDDSADAAFVVGAFEMMPAMLAEIERLRALAGNPS